VRRPPRPAHAWIDEYVDEETQDEFLDLVDLPRWRDPQDPPEDRGLERAADTMMLGLIDEVGNLAIARDIPCDVREEGFKLLTGTDPVSSCEQ
jgi:hypothetical protein